MRPLKFLILASAVTSLLSTGARADDVMTEQPLEPVDPASYMGMEEAPQNNWAGVYLGGSVDHNWLTAKFYSEGRMSEKHQIHSFDGNIFAGYNVHNDNNVIYGVEGDIDVIHFGHPKPKADHQNYYTLSFNSSLRGRVGCFPIGSFLPYLTAGVAGVRMAENHDAHPASSTKKKILWGWTAGAGVETLLRKNLIARIEYRYTDFGKINQKGDSFSRLSFQEIRLGLAYKF